MLEWGACSSALLSSAGGGYSGDWCAQNQPSARRLAMDIPEMFGSDPHHLYILYFFFTSQGKSTFKVLNLHEF